MKKDIRQNTDNMYAITQEFSEGIQNVFLQWKQLYFFLPDVDFTIY